MRRAVLVLLRSWITPRRRRRWFFLLVAFLLASAMLATPAPADPFYMGADISLETFMQQQNVVFTDNGVANPMEKILYDHGANLFRLRIFVNPQTIYSNTNFGAIQSEAYDIALAQQIKANAPTAKIVLDFHYSDTWADPGKQTLPAAWATPTQTLEQLETTVQAYTTSTLQAFKNAGVMPDIVQLGNETTGGIMWPTGRLAFYDASDNNPSKAQQNASWAAYGGLLNAGIAGVRAVEEPGQRIPIALSIDRGDKNGQPQYHYGLLQASTTVPVNGFTGGGVTDFDIQGVDFYPTASNLLSTMQSNLTELANTNYNYTVAHPDDPLPMKKIMVLENNYPWKNAGVGSSQWPKTPTGQQAEFQAVRDLVLGLPHDSGMGVLYWYPEAVQVPGYNIYNGGATALFDDNRRALPALSVFEITLTPGDFNRDGLVDAADYTVWRDGFGTKYDEDDYLDWKTNFGTNGGAGSSQLASVPEPASIVLLVTLLSLIVSRRGRHRSDSC
jgi:arabinogalactan endo-1,4-beta-galactosidase